MRRQNLYCLQRLRRALGLAAVSLLAACGGGGTSPPPVVGTAINITGSLTTATGAPVVDATITLGTTSGPPASTQSDMNGNYTLPVDLSTVNTGTTVVVTVAKDGYKTCTGIVNTTNGTVSGCPTLPAASLDEAHPPPADSVLTRLGDGEVTGGATNSKLQIATPVGLTKTIQLRWPANFNLAAFQTLTANANIRGMQSSNCANKVSVLQGATADTATAVQVFSAATNTLADSDQFGAFTPYALQVPVASLSVTSNLYVKVEAGICTNGTPNDPSDDYEFVGLYGKFF